MIELNNEKLHVEFSETGAQLIRLQDQKNGRDYLWSGDPTNLIPNSWSIKK